MAQVDFEGKSLTEFERVLVKDDIYLAKCEKVDDNVVSFKSKPDGKDKKRIILRWKLGLGQEITQFTSVDVKIGVGKYSPTSSYSFLEKAGELENFKKMAAGKSEIADYEVLNFFKVRFLGREAKLLTKTVTSADGRKYSVIDRVVEVAPKA